MTSRSTISVQIPMEATEVSELLSSARAAEGR